MAKRYLLVDPRELEQVAKTLDKAFPYKAPKTVWTSVWELGNARWFNVLRFTIAMILIAANVWRLLRG